jgi:predicted MFS family arabinose efflux permease
LVLFAGWSAGRAHPLMDLRLYRHRVYLSASIATAFAGASVFGAALLFPLYLQLARHQDVLSSALLLIPIGVGTSLMSPLAGVLIDRLGGAWVALSGALLAGLTTLPFAFVDADMAPARLEALLFVRGMSLALAITPLVSVAYASVARERLGDATTQVNILLRLGGALGGALFALIVAAQLPHGADHAFHLGFACLTASSLLTAVCGLWLLAVSRAETATAAAAGRRSGLLRQSTSTGDAS